MPMGAEDHLTAKRDQTIVSQHRKFEHHLVHLCLAVAADTVQLILQRIQHGDDFLRRIVPRKIISRSMIENVAEKKHARSPFPLPGLQQFPAVIG